MLRRSKRPRSAISPEKAEIGPFQLQSSTPSKKRPQKRARFSDSALVSGSTGLTPAVGKASLKTPKTRRASTPAPSRYPIQSHGEVQFSPLRECLEPRTIRRLRRHGLSEEMNQYHADQKTNAALQRELQCKNDELKKLRAENEKLRIAPASSQERIEELQAEVTTLQHTLANNADSNARSDRPNGTSSPPSVDEGGFQIYEDAEDANDHGFTAVSLAGGIDPDALAMSLELESARQAKQLLFRSSQGPANGVVQFASATAQPDSPSNTLSPPALPPQFYHDLSKQLKAVTNLAETAQLEVQVMNAAIKSLGFPFDESDVDESISHIGRHFRAMRLELEHLLPGETAGSFDNANLMPEMVSKLKMLSEKVRLRETELRSLRDQQRSLKGNFDHALGAAEKANGRITELEAVIDKYAEDLLEQRMRAQTLERDVRDHEANHQSLIAAIEKYRSEVKRLEELVQLIESEQASRLQDVRAATVAEFTQQLSDMGAMVTAETEGRKVAETSAVERLCKINDLESMLSAARQNSEDIKAKLEALVAESTRTHQEEVGGLNSRISGLSTALTSANAEIERLRTTNAKLEDRYRREVEHGARAVDRMQDELLRGVARMGGERKSYLRAAKVRHANWELESDDLASDEILPMTPASTVRFSDVDLVQDHVDGRVEMTRGKSRSRGHDGAAGLEARKGGRRRYDSGIGMDLSSEADLAGMEPEIVTPDFSSDADFEHQCEALHEFSAAE